MDEKDKIKELEDKLKKHDSEFAKLIKYAESTNMRLIQTRKEFEDYKKRTNGSIIEIKRAINTIRGYLRKQNE